jgi:hypothetical protein
LSKTVINNLIGNIGNKEDFDKVSNGLEAAKQYLQTKKIENPATKTCTHPIPGSDKHP